MLHMDCIDEDVKQDAMSLMHRVRDQHEKPIYMLQGRKGKYLDPGVTTAGILGSGHSPERDYRRRNRPAALLCMPYFCLAPYSDQPPSQASNFYPMRTLLQYSHVSTPKKRDLQQAITGLDLPKGGYIFHVPQMWCLILGKGLFHKL